jgi:hypothetical protein
MTKKKKITKAEKNRRVQLITKLLCQRLSRGEILQYTTKKTDWDLVDRQIDTYIADATSRLKKQRAYNRDTEFVKLVKALDELYIKAKADKDYRTCLAIVRELSELLNLKEYKPVEIGDLNITQVNQEKNIYNIMSEKEAMVEWQRRQKLKASLESKKKKK